MKKSSIALNFLLGLLGLVAGAVIAFELTVVLSLVWEELGNVSNHEGGFGLLVGTLAVMSMPIGGIIALTLNLFLKGKALKRCLATQLSAMPILFLLGLLLD